jgi:2-dehydropantoate 2-reductase
VYVVGAGAVGRYLGDLLAAGGADVAYAPRAVADVTRSSADVAIVAVKAYQTPSAVATLRRAGLERALIVTPQNGVGNEEELAAAFGADRVISAALTVPVERLDDGTIVAANRGGLAIAPVGAGSCEPVVALFAKTPLAVRVFPDYRALKWSKLALNIIANAGCAILDVTPRVLVSYADVFALEIEAIREVRRVMRALGVRAVDLPRYPVRALFAATALPTPLARPILGRRFESARGHKLPSLLLDVRSGKGETEIGALNGAVARAAERVGVLAPVNAAFAKVGDAVARDPHLRATYRENPRALVDAVAAERRVAPARRTAVS